jgi:hypothetical protein
MKEGDRIVTLAPGAPQKPSGRDNLVSFFVYAAHSRFLNLDVVMDLFPLVAIQGSTNLAPSASSQKSEAKALAESHSL